MEGWLDREDDLERSPRIQRLEWLVTQAPAHEDWFLNGGWIAKSLFEEARYTFVYGQFLASILAGLAFIERSLAALFYGSGRDDLQRAGFSTLVREAVGCGWLTPDQAALLNQARQLRNRTAHFRRPLDLTSFERKAVELDQHPYDLVEEDCRQVIELAFLFIGGHPFEVPSERVTAR